MISSSRVFYKKNGQVVSKPDFSFDDLSTVDSPLEWLSSGEKPELFLPEWNYTPEKMKKLSKYIALAPDQDIEIHFLNLFLYHGINELIKDQLNTDWRLTSNLTIAKGEMTPMDLLKVTKNIKVDLANIDTNDQAEPPSTIELITMLLANYRVNVLNRNAINNYRTILITRMDETFRKEQFTPDGINTNIYNYTSWVNDLNYRKICASVDMFFNKFRNNKYGSLRMCVQGSRYKDCSLLTDIEFGKKLLGVDMPVFFTFAVDSSVNKELLKVLELLNENTHKDNYFPYIKEMAVISKSPYSASHCPNSHNWIHMTGTLLGETRSINSRLAPNGQNIQTLNLALSCAFSLKDRVDVKPAFAKSQDELEELQTLAGDVENNTLNPRLIMKNIFEIMNGTSFGDEIKDWARERVRGLMELRDGTIGKYVKEQFNY